MCAYEAATQHKCLRQLLLCHTRCKCRWFCNIVTCHQASEHICGMHTPRWRHHLSCRPLPPLLHAPAAAPADSRSWCVQCELDQRQWRQEWPAGWQDHGGGAGLCVSCWGTAGGLLLLVCVLRPAAQGWGEFLCCAFPACARVPLLGQSWLLCCGTSSP